MVAAVLLLLSVFCHSGWNFLSKKKHPTLAFYLVANLVGVLSLLPVLVFYHNKISLIPAEVWILVNVSGLLLAGYMAALAKAYRNGDMSVVYPIARSIPVIFVAVATMVFGLGEILTPLFLVGAGFIMVGCVMLPMKNFRKQHIHMDASSMLAIFAAACIAGYTISDSRALACLTDLPEAPFSPIGATLVYTAIEAFSAFTWKGVFVACSRQERFYIEEILRNYKGVAVITGIGIYLTYGLVLASMNYVTNVSYVAACRQLSIPLGAVFGILFLGEPPYFPRITGIVFVFSGLIVAIVN